MDNDNYNWVIPVLLALVAGGAGWYYWQSQQRTAPVAAPVEDIAEADDSTPQSPAYPMPEPRFESVGEGELVELPPLGDSDEYLKLEIGELLGNPVGDLLVDARIIERMVGTIDNLPRSHVAERIRPVGGLSSPFVAEPVSDSLYEMTADSYARYDSLVDVVTAADVGSLADLYQRYYPLFQDAYAGLGYPDAYFNDRLVAAIDDMLATPEPAGPVNLVRPHVLFEFEDPDLQSRSAGQKLLLRMGPDNAARVKAKLRELRDAVVSQD